MSQLLLGVLLIAFGAVNIVLCDIKSGEQCVGPDGKMYNLHEKFSFGEFWWECISNGSCPYCKVSGCVSPDGKFLNAGDQYINGSYILSCQVAPGGSDTPHHVVTGCVAPDGKKLNPGETYNRDKYVYQCESNKVSNEISHKVVGCVADDGKVMKNGDQFIKDRGIYECQAPGEGPVKLVIVGCADAKGGKVNVGSTFLHPADSEFQYRNLCAQQKSDVVSVTAVACRYSGGGFNIELKPGCYKAVDNGEYFTCTDKFGDGGLYIDFTNKKEDIGKLQECVYSGPQ